MRYPGLLPFAEPRDGELVSASLVGNDAWGIAGCRAAATLALLAGDSLLIREARAAERDYRATFLAALARIARPDVPPSWEGPGRDWGNASAGYPTRALPPDDPRLAALARRMESRAAPSGLVCYGPDDTLHSYLGADLAQSALQAGRPAEARRYLAGLLAASSSTLGQAETASREGGFGPNLPPHATAAATLVDLLRNMILCDDRDTVEIAAGASLEWWQGTRLDPAPTRFGMTRVSLDRPAADVLHATLGPLPVPVRVRVPEEVRAVEVRTAGARISGPWIEVPAGAGEVTFRIAPAVGVAR
jgi:hypothetical protein